MQITEKQLWKELRKVLDPELGVSIVDLGLIYHVEVKKNGIVAIRMTLTTIGCPLVDVIQEEMKKKLKDIGVIDSKLKIDVVFEPPWTMDRISKEGKVLLGL